MNAAEIVNTSWTNQTEAPLPSPALSNTTHQSAWTEIIAAHAAEAFFLMDPEGRVTFLNRAAEEMFGWKAEELLGQVLHDRVHYKYPDGTSFPMSACPLGCVLRTGHSLRHHEDVFFKRDGTPVSVRCSNAPVMENGKLTAAVLIVSDITEQKRVEQASRDSEAQFRAMFDISSVGMAQTDCAGRFVRVNAALCSMTAYSESELVGRSFLDFTHPDDRALNSGGFQNLVDRKEKSYRVEKRYIRKDGQVIWVNVLVNLVQDTAGRPFQTVALIQDVTARKEAEEARNQAVERYAIQTRLFDGVVSTTPDFVYIFDPQGRFVYANRRLLEVWGMQLSEAEGKTCLELGYEQWHHDMHMREIAQVIRTKQSIKGEVPFKAPLTGVYGVYEYIFTPVMSPSGEVELIAGTTRDITERKQGEEALRKSEERYRELFSSMTEGFCVIEKMEAEPGGPIDFRFVVANHAFAHHSGLIDAVGKTMREVAPAEACDWIAIYDEVLRTGTDIHFVRELLLNNRSLELYAYRVGSEAKQQVGIVFRDVTERKKVENALAAAKRQLEQHALHLEHVVAERTAKLRETVEELEHFSYTITHDMRAPLRAMQAFGEILTEEYEALLDGAGRDYLRRIIEASKRMDRLITDALTYSKTVQLELSVESVDLGPLLRGIVESYPQFQSPKAEIDIADAPAVLANPAALTQCFSNLLGNAVKFVEPGTIPRVRVWGESKGTMVRVWVEDNGIGIPADQKGKLFGMFQRMSSKYEGTGVGLALVRKVVQKMRGTVGYESELGQGSRFWVELPAASASAKP